MADDSDLSREQSHAERAGELENEVAHEIRRAGSTHQASEARRNAMLKAAAKAGLAQSHRLAVVGEGLDAIHDRIDDIKSSLP